MINIVKTYFKSLRTRDRRALLFGGASAAIIIVYLYVGLPLIKDWSQIRSELKMYRNNLENISGQTPGDKAKLVGLSQAVPLVELPLQEDVQRKLFWDKTYDQLKKTGIKLNSGPAYTSSKKKKNTRGFGALRLEFSGSCKYEQFVQFLGYLNENPYLVSIEELTLKSDEKKKGQIDVNMTLETLVK